MKKKILALLIVICGAVMIFAACNSVEFEISFVVDGRIYNTVTTSGNAPIGMPADPEKEDYVFDGWFWDKDTWARPFTANSLLDAPLSSNMSVYAKWRAEKKETTTYTLKGMVVKMEGFADIPIDVDRMNDEQAALYGYLFDLYGRSVDIDSEAVYFTGSVLSLYSPADYLANGTQIVFTNSTLRETFTYCTLEKDKFSFGVVTNGAGFAFEYYTEMTAAPVIEYDTAKTAISVHDEEIAASFGATATDARGRALNVFVTRTGGQKSAGTYVDYLLSATDADGNTSTAEIKNVAVYGDPALRYTPIDHMLVGDAATPDFFSATATDSFEKPLEVRVEKVRGTQAAGQTVFYKLWAVDAAGNRTEEFTYDIKVYGAPVIGFNQLKTHIKVNETVSPSALGIFVRDSFGNDLNCEIEVLSGRKEAGQTMSFRVSARDILGQTVTRDISGIKVYGMPVIAYNESVTAIKASDHLQPVLFGASAVDSFGVKLPCELVIVGGKPTAGTTMSFRIKATDSTGQTATQDIAGVKVYGKPTIDDNGSMAVRTTDALTPELFGIVAADSFENKLECTMTVVSGTQTAGEEMIFRFTAADIFGQTATRDIAAKVYGAPVLTLNENLKSIKTSDDITSALFGAAAKDSFGGELQCAVTIVSGTQTAGKTMSFRLCATDALGQIVTRDVTEIKVYGAPILTLVENVKAIKATADLTPALFGATAKDSFDEGLDCTLTVIGGSQTAGSEISFRIGATDAAGNTVTREITGVKVYGAPRVDYDQSVKNIKASDQITPSLFGAVALDSFNVELDCDIEIIGTPAGGKTISVVISATDALGQTSSVSVNGVKVYGTFAIEYDTAKTAIKASDTVNALLFDVKATDSFDEVLTIEVTYTASEIGHWITVIARAYDAAGNYAVKSFSVKVYDLPDLSYSTTKNAVKATDNLNDPDLYNARGLDSFGQSVTVAVTIRGDATPGGRIDVTLTVTDCVGNVTARTLTDVGVYALPTFAWDPNIDALKASEGITAESFPVLATDSFKNHPTVNSRYEGTMAAGSCVTLIFEATDAAGNTATLTVPGIKVYGTPEIKGCADKKHYVGFGIDPGAGITAVDSFDKDLTGDIALTYEYNPDAVGTYEVTITVRDRLGNEAQAVYMITVDAFVGAGTLADPYLIENAAQLKIVRNYLTSNFKLTTDLDMQGYEWTPIGCGNQTVKAFAGIIDGYGHTISNIVLTKMKDYDSQYVGLVGELTGSVINLTVIDATIPDITYDYLSYAGVIAAKTIGGKIINCVVSADLSFTAYAPRAGAIAGYIGNSLVANCKYEGDFYVKSRVTGTSADSVSIGALIGRTVEKNHLLNCYVLSTSSKIVGQNAGMLSAHNCFFNREIVENNMPEQGAQSYNWIENAYGATLYAYNCGGFDTQDMKSASHYVGYNPLLWNITAGSYPTPKLFGIMFAGGDGSAENPYIVADANQLDLIRYFADADFLLAGDIDASTAPFAPINVFSGRLDGGGHMLTVALAADYYTGLTGTLTGCVENLSLTVTGTINGMYAAALAGRLDGGAIVNCDVTTEEIAGTYGGGVVGYLASGTIENVTAVNPRLCSKIYRGGVAAYLKAGYIRNCRSETVTTEDYASAYGDVRYIGGIVGYAAGGVTERCFADAQLYALGRNEISNPVYAGGITGYTEQKAVIKSCQATGIVNAMLSGSISATFPKAYAGGIAGVSAGSIRNCIFEGTVSATAPGGYNLSYAGGIAGSALAGAVMKNCVAVGTVSATQYAGGIAGSISAAATVTNVFYDTDVCALAAAFGSGTPGGENVGGRTTAELKQRDTFAGFGEYVSPEDVAVNDYNVWVFAENAYPALYWMIP